MDYKQKYLKYKQKYLQLLRDQKGGEPFLMDLSVSQVFSYLFERNQRQLRIFYNIRAPVMMQPLGNFTLNPRYRSKLLSRSSLIIVLVTRLLQSRLGYQLAKRIMGRMGREELIISPITQIADLIEHTDTVESVAFHPTLPLLASGSYDRTVKLWDCSNIQKRPTLKATITDTYTVHSVAFHPTLPLLASGSIDSTVKLWDCSQNPPTLKATILTDTSLVTIVSSLAFHSTLPLLASVSFNKAVKLWDCSDLQNPPTLKATITYTDSVRSVAFHPTLPILAFDRNNDTIKLWNCSNSQHPIEIANLNAYGVRSVAFHPNLHLLASGSRDATVKLWR